MTRKNQHRTAEAFIERGEIVIRLPIAIIESAYNAGVDLGCIETGFKAVDAKAFAPDVVRALNDENPDNGTTAIHRLFDAAFTEAIEQGAEGVEEDPACGECGLPARTCICDPGASPASRGGGGTR